MPTKTRNGAAVPVGSDPYALTADLKKMMESANYTIPVTNKTERDGLDSLFPNGVLPVGTTVERLDLPGLSEKWTGSRWFSNSGAVHLEIARTAGANLANNLWGPGVPSELTAGVDQDASRNPSQFSFPSNNFIAVAIEGLYALSWAVTNFNKSAQGFITIRRASTNQVLASKPISQMLDVTVERPSIYLPAGASVAFNFQTTEALSCKHLLSITKIG